MNHSKRNYNTNEIAEIKIIPDYKDDVEAEILKKDNNLYSKETSETEHTKQEDDDESFSDAPYLMTVEIGNSHSKKLKIYHDSIPEEIAFEFCKKHNLDFLANDYLVNEIRKILQQDKSSHKIENDMNNNFSEIIHEVDEEYMNSDMNRKESSDKVKGIEEREEMLGNRKEILFLDCKNPHSYDKEENGKSKISHSPFATENNSTQGDNGLYDVCNMKKPVKDFFNKLEPKGKKSTSLKTCNSIKKNNQIHLSDNNHDCVKNKENRYKSDFELRCERVKRLREMKAYFSNTYKSQFLSPPPIYDFSILKGRIQSCSNVMNQSINYKRNKQEVVKKIKEKYNLHEEMHNFSPKTINNTEKHIKEKIYIKSENNIFSNLYDLAKKRSIRLAMMRNENHDKLDIKPLINNNLRISSTFDERQKVFSKKVEEKRKRINTVPTSRGASNEKRNINVHEMLYIKGQTSIKSKEKMKKERLDQICLDANKIFTTTFTENLLNVKKKEAFKKFFLILDSDQDKEISIHNIDLGKIPESIKTLINPILSMIASSRSSLKEEMFYKEMDNLFKNLSYDKKKLFLNFIKNAHLEPKMTKFDHRVNMKYRLYTSKLTSSLASSKTSAKSIVDIMTKRLNKKLE